jgi:hypothetical protein
VAGGGDVVELVKAGVVAGVKGEALVALIQREIRREKILTAPHLQVQRMSGKTGILSLPT